jgi:hypothetical protein
MNIIFKIMLFSIVLNFATGLMITALPEIGNNPNYNINLNPSDANADAFMQGMNQTVSPTTESNSFFRLLDNIVVGVISKLLGVINNYMFGFLNFMGKLLALDTGVINIMKSILGICYTLGAFWLWTGKNLTQ